ncbi:Kelch-like protein 5 [Hordeum vulgare]|nr:Kelch-like protein 5 [Hordeum vulgare]
MAFDMSTQEFSLAIVLSESQFSASYVEDSNANIDQMPLDLEVFEEELAVFSSMSQAVKEVVIAIRDSKTVDVHPELYGAVMEQVGFSPEALMVALSQFLDNKAQGVGQSGMRCSKGGYNNQSHKGYKTRQATKDAYSKYVLEQGCIKVEIVKVDRPFGLKNFIIFVQFMAIAVFVVLVRSV